jgi:hypothetical protein
VKQGPRSSVRCPRRRYRRRRREHEEKSRHHHVVEGMDLLGFADDSEDGREETKGHPRHGHDCGDDPEGSEPALGWGFSKIIQLSVPVRGIRWRDVSRGVVIDARSRHSYQPLSVGLGDTSCCTCSRPLLISCWISASESDHWPYVIQA